MKESVRYAGFLIRSWAAFMDWVLITVAATGIQYALLGLIYWIHSDWKPNPLEFQIMNGILYGILSFPYYSIGHFRYGTTLGKKVFRIVVVDQETLRPITAKQSVVRCLSYVLSYATFVGFLMAIFQSRKQALHDLVAGTVSIVSEKR